MTRRLLFLIALIMALSTAGYSQQILGWYSTIWIDSRSGEIFGQGISQVYPPNDGSTMDLITASAVTQVQNAVGSATDNCGSGCAIAQAYGQVNTLGEFYIDNSAHSGTLDFADGAYYFEYETSSASQLVPDQPQIYLTGINAYEPHSVLWRYSVSGTCPYSLSLSLPPNVYSFNTACSGVFSSDQSQYEPNSYNVASITGYMYGLVVQGSMCPVSRYDNQSFSDTSSSLIGTPDLLTTPPPESPQAFPLFYPIHHGTDVVTWYQYCMALDPASLQTRLLISAGSLDTTKVDPADNSAINDIGETHTIISGGSSQTGIVYGMGPDTDPLTFLTANEAHFMTKEIVWGDWWLPPGSGVDICNTAAWYEPEAYYPYNPSPNATNLYSGPTQGCVYLTLP